MGDAAQQHIPVAPRLVRRFPRTLEWIYNGKSCLLIGGRTLSTERSTEEIESYAQATARICQLLCVPPLGGYFDGHIWTVVRRQHQPPGWTIRSGIKIDGVCESQDYWEESTFYSPVYGTLEELSVAVDQLQELGFRWVPSS